MMVTLGFQANRLAQEFLGPVPGTRPLGKSQLAQQGVGVGHHWLQAQGVLEQGLCVGWTPLVQEQVPQTALEPGVLRKDCDGGLQDRDRPLDPPPGRQLPPRLGVEDLRRRTGLLRLGKELCNSAGLGIPGHKHLGQEHGGFRIAWVLLDQLPGELLGQVQAGLTCPQHAPNAVQASIIVRPRHAPLAPVTPGLDQQAIAELDQVELGQALLCQLGRLQQQLGHVLQGVEVRGLPPPHQVPNNRVHMEFLGTALAETVQQAQAQEFQAHRPVHAQGGDDAGWNRLRQVGQEGQGRALIVGQPVQTSLQSTPQGLGIVRPLEPEELGVIEQLCLVVRISPGDRKQPRGDGMPKGPLVDHAHLVPRDLGGVVVAEQVIELAPLEPVEFQHIEPLRLSFSEESRPAGGPKHDRRGVAGLEQGLEQQAQPVLSPDGTIPPQLVLQATDHKDLVLELLILEQRDQGGDHLDGGWTGAGQQQRAVFLVARHLHQPRCQGGETDAPRQGQVRDTRKVFVLGNRAVDQPHPTDASRPTDDHRTTSLKQGKQGSRLLLASQEGQLGGPSRGLAPR